MNQGKNLSVLNRETQTYCHVCNKHMKMNYALSLHLLTAEHDINQYENYVGGNYRCVPYHKDECKDQFEIKVMMTFFEYCKEMDKK